MRPAAHARTPSVADVVRRAVEACDPSGVDAPLGDYLARFEDRDEPVSALGEDRAREFFEVEGAVEGLLPDPALQMAAAVATYLAFRRDTSLDAADDELLRLAARAEFGADPPADVAVWLSGRGVEP